MVDVEFAVQFLVLAHAHEHAALTQNLGNIALLRIAGELALVPPALALGAADAYREFRRLQHQVRLTGAPHARVDPDPQAPRRDRGLCAVDPRVRRAVACGGRRRHRVKC